MTAPFQAATMTRRTDGRFEVTIDHSAAEILSIEWDAIIFQQRWAAEAEVERLQELLDESHAELLA